MISSGVLGILTIIEVKISFANQYDGMTFQLLNTAHAPWEFSHMGLSIRIITHQLQWFLFAYSLFKVPENGVDPWIYSGLRSDVHPYQPHPMCLRAYVLHCTSEQSSRYVNRST